MKICEKKEVNLMTGINILAEYTAGGTPVVGIVVSSMLAVLGLIIFSRVLTGGMMTSRG